MCDRATGDELVERYKRWNKNIKTEDIFPGDSNLETNLAVIQTMMWVYGGNGFKCRNCEELLFTRQQGTRVPHICKDCFSENCTSRKRKK